MAALGWLQNLAIGGAEEEVNNSTDWYGTITVATAGVGVQFTSADVPVKRIYFKAPSGNSGDIYLGGSDVSSTVMGRLLEPGDTFEMNFTDETASTGRWGNLREFYADAASGGDTLQFLAVPVGG